MWCGVNSAGSTFARKECSHVSIELEEQKRPKYLNIRKMLILVLCIGVSACGSNNNDPSKSATNGELFVPNDSQISLINQGVGLMGSFDYAGALAVFEPLANSHPAWDQAVINYAIALKNRQGEGDAERALSVLDELLQRSPNNAQANYISGVLNLYLGQVFREVLLLNY